jgi:hypothetical protein
MYLGIWYHSIPGPRTVVWVANRDNPIIGLSSPTLAITNSSDLELSDSRGGSSPSSASELLQCCLMRGTWSSDLQMVRPHGRALIIQPTQYFQIWDFWWATRQKSPCALLLGTVRMTHLLGISHAVVTLALQTFSSPLGTRQNRIAALLCGVVSLCPLAHIKPNASSVLSQMTVNSGDDFYLEYTISDSSTLMRIMLDYTGKLNYLNWNSHTSSWALFGEHPSGSAPCELYASCGPFSYCDFTLITPACQCLDGFVPVHGSKGCQRKQALKCGKQSQFVLLSQMKVPDKFLHIRNRSLDECAAECSRNCSCTAYAYNNLSSAGEWPTLRGAWFGQGSLSTLGSQPLAGICTSV